MSAMSQARSQQIAQGLDHFGQPERGQTNQRFQQSWNKMQPSLPWNNRGGQQMQPQQKQGGGGIFGGLKSAFGGIFGGGNKFNPMMNQSKFNPMNMPGLSQARNTMFGKPGGIGPSMGSSPGHWNMGGRTTPIWGQGSPYAQRNQMGSPPWNMNKPPMQRGPNPMDQPDNGQRMDPYELYKQQYGRGTVAPSTPMASREDYMKDFNNMGNDMGPGGISGRVPQIHDMGPNNIGRAPEAMQPAPQFGGIGPSQLPAFMQPGMGGAGPENADPRTGYYGGYQRNGVNMSGNQPGMSYLT